MGTVAKVFLYSLFVTLIAGIILLSSDIISVELLDKPQLAFALQFIFTIIIVLFLTKGSPGRYGIKLPYRIAIRRISFWVVLLFFFGYLISIFFDSDHPVGEEGLVDQIFKALIVAPILEELVFRGFIQSFLSRFKTIGLNFRKVFISYPVIFAALLFSFAHLPMIMRDMSDDLIYLILKLTYIFGLGILMGYVREKSDSLIPAIIIHFSINLLSLVVYSVLLS